MCVHWKTSNEMHMMQVDNKVSFVNEVMRKTLEITEIILRVKLSMKIEGTATLVQDCIVGTLRKHGVLYMLWYSFQCIPVISL